MKFEWLVTNHSVPHASEVLVIFSSYFPETSDLIDIIMHYDVGGCVICISNIVEYLEKELREIEKF